jgi:hypothetical protein
VTLGWDQGSCTYTKSLDTTTGAYKQECEFTFIFREGGKRRGEESGSFTLSVRSRPINLKILRNLEYFQVSLGSSREHPQCGGHCCLGCARVKRKILSPRLTIIARCSWKGVFVKRTKVLVLCKCFGLLKSLAQVKLWLRFSNWTVSYTNTQIIRALLRRACINFR